MAQKQLLSNSFEMIKTLYDLFLLMIFAIRSMQCSEPYQLGKHFNHFTFDKMIE